MVIKKDERLYGEILHRKGRTGYRAVGSGDDLALGVLSALQPMEMSPEQCITLALEAAAFHNSTVRPPFLIERAGEFSSVNTDTQ